MKDNDEYERGFCDGVQIAIEAIVQELKADSSESKTENKKGARKEER